MNLLSEPIKNTCPDINKYIKEIEETLKYIQGFDRIENPETLIELLNDCESTLSNAIDNFESIRRDNEKLRDWGKELVSKIEDFINIF